MYYSRASYVNFLIKVIELVQTIKAFMNAGLANRITLKTVFLSFIFLILLFSVPYLLIPLVILWWFYQKSKFTKKTKVLTTTGVGVLIVGLISFSIIAYANDEEPILSVIEPENNITVQTGSIRIIGEFTPPDRNVFINGELISSANGKFSTSYNLESGENKIEVSAGRWKMDRETLIITRELSDEEKEKLITPTSSQPSATPTLTPTPIIKTTATPTINTTNSNKAEAKVVKVTDGDTLSVSINGKTETIRVIGIDTPETVDPRKPVQCFGKEASDKAKSVLQGKTVYLESDTTQGNRDRYRRLLRYVWINNGTMDFGEQMVLQGYAHEYTYNTPYKFQTKYKKAQTTARNSGSGLWAANTCAGNTISNNDTNTNTSQPTVRVAAPTPTTPPPPPGNGYTCTGPDLDCPNFSSQAEAQAFFNSCGFNANYDPMRLDSVGVGDGIACESL